MSATPAPEPRSSTLSRGDKFKAWVVANLTEQPRIPIQAEPNLHREPGDYTALPTAFPRDAFSNFERNRLRPNGGEPDEDQTTGSARLHRLRPLSQVAMNMNENFGHVAFIALSENTEKILVEPTKHLLDHIGDVLDEAAVLPGEGRTHITALVNYDRLIHVLAMEHAELEVFIKKEKDKIVKKRRGPQIFFHRKKVIPVFGVPLSKLLGYACLRVQLGGVKPVRLPIVLHTLVERMFEAGIMKKTKLLCTVGRAKFSKTGFQIINVFSDPNVTYGNTEWTPVSDARLKDLVDIFRYFLMSLPEAPLHSIVFRAIADLCVIPSAMERRQFGNNKGSIIDEGYRIRLVKLLLRLMPGTHFATFVYVLMFLNSIVVSEENDMDIDTVCKYFGHMVCAPRESLAYLEAEMIFPPHDDFSIYLHSYAALSAGYVTEMASETLKWFLMYWDAILEGLLSRDAIEEDERFQNFTQYENARDVEERVEMSGQLGVLREEDAEDGPSYPIENVEGNWLGLNLGGHSGPSASVFSSSSQHLSRSGDSGMTSDADDEDTAWVDDEDAEEAPSSYSAASIEPPASHLPAPLSPPRPAYLNPKLSYMIVNESREAAIPPTRPLRIRRTHEGTVHLNENIFREAAMHPTQHAPQAELGISPHSTQPRLPTNAQEDIEWINHHLSPRSSLPTSNLSTPRSGSDASSLTLAPSPQRQPHAGELAPLPSISNGKGKGKEKRASFDDGITEIPQKPRLQRKQTPRYEVEEIQAAETIITANRIPIDQMPESFRLRYAEDQAAKAAEREKERRANFKETMPVKVQTAADTKGQAESGYAGFADVVGRLRAAYLN